MAILDQDKREPYLTSDFVALELLEASSEPVGNHRLVEALREAGIHVAEATAGRILRGLVTRGLARTLGKRGRVITNSGRLHLDSQREAIQRYERSARLFAVVNVEDVETLLDMLHVRRALEPEAARLAAQRAEDSEIEALHRFSCAHCVSAIDGDQRLDPAVSFHRQLILASHHDLIIEVGLLVIEETDAYLLDKIALDPVMARLTREEMEREARGFATDHERISEAIRARDADLAEAEMRSHIEKLISRVERYKQISEPKEAGARPDSPAT